MPKTNVKVKLIGVDRNAFMILGKVIKALKKAGYEELVDQFIKDATSGDRNHLLRVVMEYVEVV